MEKTTILIFNLIIGSIFGFIFLADTFSFQFMTSIEEKINQNNALKTAVLVFVLIMLGFASLMNAMLNLPHSNYYIDILVLLIGAVVSFLTYFTSIQYFKKINFYYFMISLWMTLRCFYSVYVIASLR